MLRKIPVDAIVALLVALFVYTSLGKILDPDTFRGQMYNQPLPPSIAGLLVWAVPSVEMSAVVLLSIRAFRTYGLLLSSLLLLAFTIYVGLVYFNSFDRVPCSCGGVFKNMSWGSHLDFNSRGLGRHYRTGTRRSLHVRRPDKRKLHPIFRRPGQSNP
jgi:putative oxidoreductase